MYALHFSYGIGALISPIMSKPFLREIVEFNNETSVDAILENQKINAVYDITGFWTIKTLYPLIFSIMVLPLPFYVYYFIKEQKQETTKKLEENNNSFKEGNNNGVKEENVYDYLSRKKTILIMVFASLFYFTMAGVELGMRSFISVFSVESSLGLSRMEAANVLTIFYITFAGVRGLLIPISTIVSANNILIISTLSILLSTSMLSFWGETSLLVLQV